MDEPTRAQRVADAFTALASPLRVRILLALAETRRPNWDHRGMSYSDLRSAVGVEDGGRFNYHLGELRGQYVAVEDGHYWLTATGTRIVDGIYAGTFGDRTERREGTIDRECPDCGERMTVVVDDGLLRTECPAHGVVFDMPLSPGTVVDRDLETLLDWALRRAHWYMEAVSWDVCPHCGGSFGEATFDDPGERQPPDPEDPTVGERARILVGHTCSRCGIAFRVPPQAFAGVDPATVAFFHEHGLEPWSSAAQDPDRVADGADRHDDSVLVWYEIDGDRLELEFDRSLDTVAVRRTDAKSA